MICGFGDAPPHFPPRRGVRSGIMTRMLDIPANRPRIRTGLLCLLMGVTLLAIWGSVHRPGAALADPPSRAAAQN